MPLSNRVQGIFHRTRQLIRTTYRLFREEGVFAVLRQMRRWLGGERAYFRKLQPRLPDYSAYIKATTPSKKQLEEQRRIAHGWTWPHFDVVVNDQPIKDRTLESLIAQTYCGYNLVIVVDDDLPQNLTGDYVFPLAAGDVLAPDALFHIAEYLRKHRSTDALTVDQDVLDARGKRSQAWCKPIPLPENVISANPLRQGCVFSRSRWTPDAYHNRDAFTLSLVQSGMMIVRLPRILLHRPAESIPPVHTAALKQFLEYAGMQNVVIALSQPIRIDSRWDAPLSVSVVIPSKDHADLLERCLESLFSQTDYPTYEVIVVDNDSQSADTHALYDRYRATHPSFRVIDYREPFNFSRACNLGASHATGDLLLFLNNDTEILQADWLYRMARWFSVEGIGIVGPKLLYPDGSIQQAGTAFGIVDIADHLFVGAAENTETPFGSDAWYRDVSAVTGACLMIRRSLSVQIGGFDERYHLLFSDLDLCVRVTEAGKRILYVPDVRLIHHESRTHRHTIPLHDLALAKARFGDLLRQGDPLYHPSLSRRWAIPSLDIPRAP